MGTPFDAAAGAPFDLAVTDRLLSTTRAVRKRLDLDRPVEESVILECLQLATQAPTASNNQGWRFVVVLDPEKRKALSAIFRKGGAFYKEMPQPDDPQDRRVRASAEYLIDVIDRVPALVIPCHEGRPTDAKSAAIYYASIHPAIWSFQLALRSRGLGSAWTTFTLALEQEVGELLGIPDTVTQAALLPVAYTVGTDFKPAKRRDVREITFIDHWGETPTD
jgi:nitroreductase